MPLQRLLLVTPTVPYPPNWGFGIRVFQIIRELAKRLEVTVLCSAQAGDEAKVTALESHCSRVVAVPAALADDRRRRIAQLTSLVRRTSFQTSSLDSPEMAAAFDALVRDGDPDLIQIESSQLSKLPVDGGGPWVLDEHNVEYELLLRMYQTESSRVRALYNWAEYKKFRREEIASWSRATGCIVTSNRERAIVTAAVPQQQVHTAPNGVDIDFFSPTDDVPDPHSIVFTGLMTYRPNIDGVGFFVREVFPLVLKRLPKATFTIVGMGAPSEVLRLANANVRITGEVPDVRPFVQRASAVVVPLRMGSGTRLKVLEGLAMAKGMVSTSIGCEGIDVTHDQHLKIADTASDFADAVVAVMTERSLSDALGSSGRKLVEQHYSWASIIDRLHQFQRQLVE